MRNVLSNQKGYSAILLCLLMPVIIGILGICIDGGLLIYYQVKLMSATKVAAVSATSYYDMEDEGIQINTVLAEDAARRSLEKNFPGSLMVGFDINETNKNQCTVQTKVVVPVYFMKILQVFGTDVENKILFESYTASRSITRQ